MLRREPGIATAPGARTLPRTVRLARYAQFAILGLALVAGFSSLNALDPTVELLETAQRQVEFTNMSVFQTTLNILSLSTYVYVVLVVAYSLLAASVSVFYAKGRNSTRITSWVLAGIGLAGTMLVLGKNEFGYLKLLDTHPEEADAIARAHENTTIWPNTANLVVTAIAALVYMATIILLATPKSREHFSSDEE